MGLRIGEVSKLLDIPVETIRFYEAENILSPSRGADSNYRIYETWDIFFLMACMKYRSLGISVRDISKIIHAESLDFLLKKIDERQKSIHAEIQYNTLLCEKIEQYRLSLETARINEGNFWFKMIPEHLYFIIIKSQGDQYDDFDMANSSLFTKWVRFFPFVESTEHISLKDIPRRDRMNRHQWSLTVEKKYAGILKIPVNDSVQSCPPQLCLCTIVDAGKKGDLSLKLLDPAMEYLQKNEYKVSGDIVGKILVRIHEGASFHRYIEIQIPVKKI
ncbi:MAG: MerR family transcriptional regulator [Treponema sp.]|jgi:DNA-binding transcriptional MerR regulator|nr:MerR family transcriptional regulator [Treponema sp.]